jgi:GNAT superfamily N-acetyltransferase
MCFFIWWDNSGILQVVFGGYFPARPNPLTLCHEDTMRIEPSLPSDLPFILEIARNVGVFNQEEVDTVDELFQGYLKDAEKSGYHYLSAWDNATLAGFACWGPTFLTRGTVDLYWICTAAAAQGKGVARALLTRIEEEALKLGRWNVSIWTSSKSDYLPARNFYLRMGYTLALQFPDYYDLGDDLCVYLKRLDAGSA